MSLDKSVADCENLTTIEAVTDQINKQVVDIISWVKTSKGIEFLKFEKQLLVKVYDLGRLFISLFLCIRQTHWEFTHSEGKFDGKRQGAKDRLIGTVFGKVRYFRTYIYRGKIEGGYYPLDLELGLP